MSNDNLEKKIKIHQVGGYFTFSLVYLKLLLPRSANRNDIYSYIVTVI